ncbi:hypothetical protein Misp01_47360 [Microtetraspora sp. NBRC 13810]|uniref:hypothetical protein n=1 Tax=Microtetraspora sp. NBRC 13810 TaxID=3030990 RepID=UPI0024A4C82C|nr:hypothetical protein [Microtetraspora sp. NBRC 13810]GLW09607.1 hypothetical protein Misp01_47360 [Microtetraspora sp. NBRC 13810]
MRTSFRNVAAVVITVGGGMALSAAPAHAIPDPSKIAVLESIQKIDPVLMANCTTGTVANPVGAVAIPPEVPLAGCLTL